MCYRSAVVTITLILRKGWRALNEVLFQEWGSCHKRQKPQALTLQAPICNRQTRKIANAEFRNRYINLT